MKELKLRVEELEERIAPTFGIFPGAVDGEGGPHEPGEPVADGVGPVKAGFPSRDGPNDDNGNSGDGAWNAHKNDGAAGGGVVIDTE